MRTLIIEHEPDAGAGVFGEVLGEGGAVSTWRAPREPAPDLAGYGALLVLGGSVHPDQDSEYPWLGRERAVLARALAAGVPTLGVCLGHEMLCQVAGGAAVRGGCPEIGWHEVGLTHGARRDPLLSGHPGRFPAFQWHSYVVRPPACAEVLAENNAGVQALRLGERAWTIQFHAEVTEAIALRWIENYAVDADAVATRLNPAELAAQTRLRIEEWNELGRRMAIRFAELARHGWPTA